MNMPEISLTACPLPLRLSSPPLADLAVEDRSELPSTLVIQFAHTCLLALSGCPCSRLAGYELGRRMREGSAGLWRLGEPAVVLRSGSRAMVLDRFQPTGRLVGNPLLLRSAAGQFEGIAQLVGPLGTASS